MGSANGTVYSFNGAASQLLGGTVLNAFGAAQSGTIFDVDGVLSQSDDGLTQFSISGRPAGPIDYLGSGTVSLASLSLFGIPLVRLSPVPVVAFASQGTIWLLLPQGFPNLLGLNLSSLSASFSVNANQTYTLTGMMLCFVDGTLLSTPRGNLPVERISAGQSVYDIDGKVHEVVWKGTTAISLDSGDSVHPARPVVFRKGCMGNDAPFRALRVSAQHRVLVDCGGERRFVKAKFLIGHQARWDRTATYVVYHHIMTAKHIAVVSNGMPTESFFPGPYVLSTMSNPQKRELMEVLGGRQLALAYPELTKKEANSLSLAEA